MGGVQIHKNNVLIHLPRSMCLYYQIYVAHLRKKLSKVLNKVELFKKITIKPLKIKNRKRCKQWRTLLVNLGYHFDTSFFKTVNFYLLNSSFLQCNTIINIGKKKVMGVR